MEIFIEHSIKRKKDLRHWIMTAEIILTAALAIIFVFSFLFAALPPLFAWQLVIVFAAGICYGTFYAISALNVEFDYILTNDELDIDRITAKKRRKRLLSINCRSLERVAPYDEDEIGIWPSGVARVIDARSERRALSYYAEVENEGAKVMLIFEPPAEMLSAMERFAPGRVFVREGSE